MATQARVARSASAMGMHASAPVRRVFTSRLSAGEAVPSLRPVVGASHATGTVRIVVNDDDSFEYLATIFNPDGQAFTGAFLQRGDAGGAGPALATLFSDVTLRSRYIQLRGTISIARGARAEALADALREHPRDFAIFVHSSGSPNRVAIRGLVE